MRATEDISASNEFGSRWCERESVEWYALMETKYFDKVDKRIMFNPQSTSILQLKPTFRFRHLKYGIQEFHRNYVLVPAYNATNNDDVFCVVLLY